MNFKLLSNKKKYSQLSNKYLIQVDDIIQEKSIELQEWINLKKNICTNKNKRISVIKDIIYKYGKIVVKINILYNNQESIIQEYKINNYLKNCSGFVKYYCHFVSNNIFQDNYIEKSLCDINEDQNKILIMPYYKYGSIKNFDWNIDNINILKKLIKQIITYLTIAYEEYGFIHNSNLNSYIIDDNYNIIIINFEKSYIDDLKKQNILYKEFKFIIGNINISLNYLFNNIDKVLNYIDIIIENNIKIDNDILFIFIDKIEFIKKIEFI